METSRHEPRTAPPTILTLLRFVLLGGLVSSPLLLAHCASPLCNYDNFSGSTSPTHVDGCCEPGSTPDPYEYDAIANECGCPLTGADVSGTPICNAAGDAFDCTGCPPPYVEGSPCDGSRFLACQVVANEVTGWGEAPVMKCENGSWHYVFTCEVNCGNVHGIGQVQCEVPTAVEGIPCEIMADSACSPDRSVWLRCSASGWFAYETCAAGTQCQEGPDGSLGCY